MSKFDDKQVDLNVVSGGTSQQIHTPSGQIPAHGPDAPIVSPTVGTTAVAKTVVTPFQRIATVA
jgi:hypothetical protein